MSNPTSDPVALGRVVVAHCLEMGFASAGVCEARAIEREREFRAWLAAGRHGEMDWLAEDVDKRVDPRRELPGAKSIIMVADQYAARGSADEVEEGQGRIARYARGRDYHTVIKRRLRALADRLKAEHAGARFRVFVDTAPVMEREHAARAGLGWVGKHTLVIHPRLGSWMLLGGIITTLDLQPDAAAGEGEGGPVMDHCGSCTRCIDACPTGAIKPYSVDATKCISYLTIEHRTAIEAGLEKKTGEWVFGCDVCQEVCPHNSGRGTTSEPNPLHAPLREGFDLLSVLGWTKHQRSAAMGPTALKRATLAMFKRNAVLAAANAIERGVKPALASRLRKKIEDLAWDAKESEMVRGVAKRQMAKLSNGQIARSAREK